MKKIINLISYYILILFGLIGTSWIIWSRFIRQRTIREIPDILLTEYRFWILIYICCIYMYIIKNLWKEPSPNILFSEISKINSYIWKPLTTLDHATKYNNFCKEYYINFMLKINKYWCNLSSNWRLTFIISFQIIPRILLVIFLLVDTFLFCKLEIFYKVILLGLLPFIYRYTEYSFKEIMNHFIKQLDDEYKYITIYEKDYEHDISRINKTEAVWHCDRVPVEQYINVMYDTLVDRLLDEIKYDYIGYPIAREDTCTKYEKIFNKKIEDWTEQEYKELHQLLHSLTPTILDLKFSLNNLDFLKKNRIIIWPKSIIYSLYILCWGYILIVSYYTYPVELIMFKYLLTNFMLYLTLSGEPFIEHIHSINKNMITPESIYNLIKNILQNIIKAIFK